VVLTALLVGPWCKRTLCGYVGSRASFKSRCVLSKRAL